MAVPLTIIKPAGVFDGVQAHELRHQLTELLASGHNLVMLDMADVNFIDSSGLGALIIGNLGKNPVVHDGFAGATGSRLYAL